MKITNTYVKLKRLIKSCLPDITSFNKGAYPVYLKCLETQFECMSELTLPVLVMQLTVEQRVQLVTTWMKTRSLQAVAQEFSVKFPGRAVPSRSTTWRNIRKYFEEGTSHNMNYGRSGRKRTGRSQENIAKVKEVLENNHEVSCRRNHSELPPATFFRIYKFDLKFHPYKIFRRHELTPADFSRRLKFCQWLLEQDEHFLTNLVIGDEAAFCLDGKVNTQNIRRYAPQKHPPVFSFDKSYRRDKLSVWAGLCGNGTVLGPIFIEDTLNEETYLELLFDVVIPHLQEEFGDDFNQLWWAQDGAPAHRGRRVHNLLSDVFGNRVIGLGHEREWPPRSPDLTPCDFFLWGYIKSKVFTSPPQDIIQLRDKIITEFENLKLHPQFVCSSITSMRKRAELCVHRNGAHVEGQV